MKFSTLTLGVVMAILAVSGANAEEPDASSGFLTDYSQLQFGLDGQPPGSFVYLPADISERLRAYSAILVEQPVLGIAADSKVKGLKPDDAKLIADLFGQTIKEELSKSFLSVDRPGKGVIVLRTGLSNVYLVKKRRPLLGYLPVGFVLTTAKSALLDDVMDKIKLAEVVIEMEAIDSESGEVLAAVQDALGSRTDKKEFASWQELEAQIAVYAGRFQCRIENAKRGPEAQVDCAALDLPQPADQQKSDGPR